jgi:pSer/pThr/pTyr-binding forkhead associated (FHA) protein
VSENGLYDTAARAFFARQQDRRRRAQLGPDPTPRRPPEAAAIDTQRTTQMRRTEGSDVIKLRRVRLLFTAAEGPEWIVEIPPGRSIVGRGEDCAVVLADQEVSRHHAALIVDGRDVYVEDLGSANGTTIDGAPVERAELGDGQVLAIGQVRIVLERPGR